MHLKFKHVKWSSLVWEPGTVINSPLPLLRCTMTRHEWGIVRTVPNQSSPPLWSRWLHLLLQSEFGVPLINFKIFPPPHNIISFFCRVTAITLVYFSNKVPFFSIPVLSTSITNPIKDQTLYDTLWPTSAQKGEIILVVSFYLHSSSDNSHKPLLIAYALLHIRRVAGLSWASEVWLKLDLRVESSSTT